jgi:molybdopterin converting factor small subunit
MSSDINEIQLKEVNIVKITVRLFATLRINNEKEMLMDLPEGATPKDIIERLNILEKDAAIILINGRGGKIDTVIAQNDTVSIFPPVGGG